MAAVRIAVVVRDGPSNPAARVRALQYVPLLVAAGDEVRTMAWRATSRRVVAEDGLHLLSLARWADVVLLQRPNQPEALVRALAKVNPHLVVDVDDAVWVTSESCPAPRYASRFATAARSARVVVAGSEHLALAVGSMAPDVAVEVLRPSVDLDGLEVHAHTSGPAVIGWIGTPGNLRDLGPEVLDALRAVVGADPGDGGPHLRIISSAGLAVPGLAAELVPWSVEGESGALAGLDIGVMPLTDDARTRGRCGYKAIQYLAAGVPAVVSPVGAGREVVQDGVTGRWAEGTTGWHQALVDLAVDVEERARLGAAGRAWVAEHASVAATLPRLRAVLHRAAG